MLENQPHYPILAVPDQAPVSGNRFTCWLGRTMLRTMGWRLTGELPNLKKVVIIGAPHTSNWDFVIAMAVNMALGIKFSFLMKKEAFFWPMRGIFMALGGIPVDRKNSEDLVSDIGRWYREHEHVWLALTPEGTRAKVTRWKTGFLRIAEEAGVPVQLVGWHYPDKTLNFTRLWQPSGDHAADAEAMKAYIDQHFQGGNPDRQ